MKSLFIAVALASSLALAGCETLGIGSNNNPCTVKGATEAETPKLCVIRGANLVRAAYATTREQLSKDVITVAQAEDVTKTIDKAADAVKSAEAALAVADSTLDEKLLLLESYLLELLRKQAAVS